LDPAEHPPHSMSQQQQGQQGQQGQGQPDLSSVGPHTSNAQLAALLAAVQQPPPPPMMQQQQQQQPLQHTQQQQPPPMQQQQFGFGGSYGGGGNGGGFGPTSSNPCRMHLMGGCRYGASCRFTHIGPAGSAQQQQQQQQPNGSGFGGGYGGGGGYRASDSFGGAATGRTFGQGFREFVPAAQQQQHQHQQPLFQQPLSSSDKSDVIGGDSQPQQVQPQQAPATGGAASSPNLALLQALVMQQMNSTANGGQSNPQLDELIASLAKTQLGGNAQQVPAVAPAVNASPAPAGQDQNLEYLQAQAALASLAVMGARPQQQQQQQPQQGGGFNSYGQQQQRQSYGSGGFGNKPQYGGGHSHQSHGHSLPSFHAGGNFGGSNNFPLSQGPPAHLRIYSDPSQRDLRREAELFGPAHSMPTGLNFDRYNDIPVEVTGNDVPGEMKAFSDFDFPDVIRQNIELAKYKNPTPIQRFALPVAFMGRDLMACAQTGSGKTAAFLLPFIAHLVINGRPAPQGGVGRNRRYMPVGLILAPTRELATQIWEESLKFTYLTSIHSVVVYGGQDIRQQFRELDRGCDILIGTPGRLTDFVERGRISLSQISYLCLDEADRMLDMGFEPQIRRLVQEQDMTENRQTLMFSATFPKEIQRLAQDFLYNYIFIAVARVGSSSDFITQHVVWVEEDAKRHQLMQLLPQCKGLTLIFVERKKSADLLETYLTREGFAASSIHGDRSQYEREQALAMFRSGRVPILVATDVAARGLDIANVQEVINFDMPNGIDDYVHRIGRTGRAGNTGNAHSFVNEKASHMFKELFDMLHENKQVVPAWLTAAVEQSGRGMQRGGGQGQRRFGGKDYRKGGFGQHSGGRGGMAHGNLAKMGRFHPQQQQQQHQQQHGGFAAGAGMQMQQQQFGHHAAAAAAGPRSFAPQQQHHQQQ